MRVPSSVSNNITLKQMIDSNDPKYDAVRAAYWAGKAEGASLAYRACQRAVMEVINPLHRIIRYNLIRLISHDRSNANEANEILGWHFETD